MTLTPTTITLAKTKLYPIFNFPNIYQPHKFDGVKDPIEAKEWLRLLENVMALFDITN